MPEHKDMPAWRKRFLANRMAFESILFEKELTAPKPEKKHSGVLVLIAIFLFHALLLTQALLRGGQGLRQADAANLGVARQYSAAAASEGFSAAFRPGLSGMAELRPPLYYLSFFPVFRIFPDNPALALALVNSFYLLLLMLAVYYAVRKERNARAAWLAASLAAGFPFIISLGRQASPDLALAAFVSAAYCCYINSGNFESRKWSFWFGVCFSLGLLTDIRFIVYVLPLLPLVLNGILSPLTGRNMKPLLVLTLLIPVPWYFRNAVFAFAHDIFVTNSLSSAAGLRAPNLFNISYDLPLLLDGLHLVFLPPAAGAMLWLFLSLFMAYEERKLMLAWFLAPYCVFSVFFHADGNIYPALIPFAVAAGIMSPPRARNYALGLTLFFPLLYQSGFLPSARVRIGGREIGLFGLKPAESGDPANAAAVKAVYARSGGERPATVQLVGSDAYFNAESMKLLAVGLGCKNLNFVRYPKDWMGLADFVLYKDAGRDYSEEISRPGGWFQSVFRQEEVFDSPAASKLVLYSKAPPVRARAAPGNYIFNKLSLGSLSFEDVIADIGAFDEISGAYDFVEVFIPHFSWRGADIYSLRFRFEGLSAFPLSRDFSDIRLTGCKAVRILSLKLREETLNALLKLNSSDFTNLRVQLDDGLTILGSYRDIGISAGFSVAPKASGLRIKLKRLTLGRLGLPVPVDIYGDDEEDSGAFEEAAAPAPARKRNIARLKPLMRRAGKDLAQLSDSATDAMLKISGYDKEVARLIESAKEEEERQSLKPVRRAPMASPRRVLSWLVGVFSAGCDFPDEGAVPFEIKINSVAIRDGLMTVK